ncbi:TM2 domain-containing protein [Corynebacterium argentoratense]|uniref:TM2 domain-containing protein n=1 Tax=Corynebacterium argentoratense TaxID=42817 RepID=UPI003C6FF7CC
MTTPSANPFDPNYIGGSNQNGPQGLGEGATCPTGSQQNYPVQQSYQQQSYQQRSYPQPAFQQQAPMLAQYNQPAMYTGGVMPGLQPKSYAVAALLCFFLGEFGGHDFYLGYNGRAVFKLLLFFSWLIPFVDFLTIPLLLIWVLVDFICILARAGAYQVDARGMRLN